MAMVVITGANRGIGRELARQVSQRGDHVVAACRSGGLREPAVRAIMEQSRKGVSPHSGQKKAKAAAFAFRFNRLPVLRQRACSSVQHSASGSGA